MLAKIARIITEICEAEERNTLHQAMQRGVETLGLATYNLSCHKRSAKEFMTEPTLTSWSREDLASYDSNRWYNRDPLLAYASQPGPPKAWSPEDWRNCSQFGDYAEYLDDVGILSGVTAPLAYKNGLTSAITTLSFTKSHQPPETATAVYIIGQAAMFRADALGITDVDPSAYVKPLYGLSELQLEILAWASKGKSNGDIAVITQRSRRVINYHMSEILRKIGVSSRAQAVGIYSAQHPGPASP